MTKGKTSNDVIWNGWFDDASKINGKVIGEFVCNYITKNNRVTAGDVGILHLSCLNTSEYLEYANNKPIFCWHISDLVIYDKPKELSEFYRECETYDCDSNCKYFEREYTPSCDECWCSVDGKIPIIRPPQSWCY